MAVQALASCPLDGEHHLTTRHIQVCAALFPPAYRPYSDAVGYSEVQVTKDTWEVEYVGPSTLTELQAKEMAILRAAELTRLMGGRWFTLVSESSKSRRVRVTSEKVEQPPAQASDSTFRIRGNSTESRVVTREVTHRDDWIPHILLRFRMDRTEGTESLDAESVLRMGQAEISQNRQ